MAFVAAAVLALVALTSVSAHPTHVEARGLAAGTWSQGGSHSAARLFARQNNHPVGSPEWMAQYPNPTSKPSQAEVDIPELWLTAYRAAKAAGKIPDIPIATQTGGLPTYGDINLMDPRVCSSAGKCKAADDIWDAPAGQIGLNFDDGPWLGTTKLLDFMQSINQTATHYLIGSYVVRWPNQVTRAFNQGHELAVHTWSHPKMASESDLGVVVELGWTMQVIHDLTGGRVPKFWRPPTGDCDNRVRAIAREVFGLTTVLWNYDTEDWSLSAPTPVYGGVRTSQLLAQWLAGPKSPGLIILQHELTDDTVQLFVNSTWPGIQQNGWKPSSIAAMFNLPMYQNAQNDRGPVTTKNNMAVNVPPGANTSTTRSTSQTSAPSGGASTPTPSSTNTDTPVPSETPDGTVRQVASVGFTVFAAVLAAMLV